MKPRTLLILFLLVVALGAFVWFVERDLPGTEERAEKAKKVLTFETGDVTGLTLEAEGRTVRLETEPEPAKPEEGEESEVDAGLSADLPITRKWRLVEPMTAAADAGQVRRLLDSLAGLEKQRTLEDLDEHDAEQLGLARPRATVTLRTGDGEVVLRVGAEVPGSDSMVVAPAEGEEAYVVSNAVYSDLTRAPGDWRDKALFPGERADVQSIRVSSAAGAEEGATGGEGEAGAGAEAEEILLARRGDDFWLESPLSDRADRDQGDRLLSDLVNLRASRFVDEPPPAEELGLEPPAGRFQVVLAGREEPFRLEVGAPVSEGSVSRYVRAGGQLAEVQTDLGRWLGKEPGEWRSRKLSRFDSWEIDAATVEDSQGAVTLERSGTDWKRGEGTIAFTPVSDLFAAVTDAEAARLLALEEAPEAEPTLTLTFTSSAGQEEVIRLYPALAGGVPARAEGREAVLLLPADQAQEITSALAGVRAAEPLPEEETELPEDVEIESEEGS